ncbi:fungal-specific transcription factor domain-containing protein [Exophiala viscosa]|uniref:fungal-specific transcription factor domain-containing protein n=1 Tax=Exophiala viscosa TaxID=2486360 RepID=UPI00218F8FF6|nr:fungal-specific transcription factor domain-containing protein [Exophiala viscosa]
MDNENDTGCARRILSCARCRRRKQKCDRRLPQCSQCAAARAECNGFSVADQHVDVPRSVIHFLESQIAQLEIELSTCGLPSQAKSGVIDGGPASVQAPQPPASNHQSPATPLDALENEIIQSMEIGAAISATIPIDPALTDLVSRVRMGLTPSLVLPTMTGTSPESRRAVVSTDVESERVECSTLLTLPDHVVHALVNKYVGHVLPQTPIFLSEDINRHLEAVQAKLRHHDAGRPPERVEPSYHFLILYLVLAIASTLGCAKSQHESRCIAFSEILFREGIAHVSTGMPFPNELAGIQATLLMLQYAEINPNCANIWILSGAAMRSCVELGLHREPRGTVLKDPRAVNQRRRIFWMAYCMDRMVSPALQRPLSIPDTNINTLYPTPMENRIGQPSGGSSPSMSRPPTVRLIEYCRIQSELTEVHFQNKPLAREWNTWVADMERTLNQWYREDPKPDDSVELAYAYAQVRLHRPSPRMIMPRADSLVAAFDAACKAAKHQRESITGGFFRRLWLASHHTAETSMVAVFCLRHAFDEILAAYSIAELFDMTKGFTSNLLTLAAQGWSEIATFAATLERLLSPLINAAMRKDSSLSLSYPTEMDNELNNFLLPKSASQEAFLGGPFPTHLPDLDMHMDFDMLNANDLFFEAFADISDQQGWTSLDPVAATDPWPDLASPEHV